MIISQHLLPLLILTSGIIDSTIAFTPLPSHQLQSSQRQIITTYGKQRRHNLLRLNEKKQKKTSRPARKVKSKPKGFAGALRDLQIQSFKYAGEVRPGKQSDQRVVTDPRIIPPDYASDGKPKNGGAAMLPWVIEVKSASDIEKMRTVGKVAREVLDIAGRAVCAGITTDEIDALVHEETLKRGAYPSPLNYRGFPKSCCTSVNEVICHGIPDDRQLKSGDIINLDITCYLNGFHGDCSEMFVVGDHDLLPPSSKKLLQTTYDCWLQSMEFVAPGRDYKDIGAIIEDHVTEKGFTTVRNFCGHGIGRVFHTNPNIYHYRNNEPNGQMAPGHTFTIEPMICEGTAKGLLWPDEWTVTTQDGKRTAQFEHTLLVTPDGVEALTGKLPSSPVQFWELESEVHKGVWLGTSANAKKQQREINKEKGVVET